LGTYHQQLWITAQTLIKGRKEEFTKPFTLNVHLYDFEQQETNDKLHLEYFNRTRNLHCLNEVSGEYFSQAYHIFGDHIKAIKCDYSLEINTYLKRELKNLIY
jgi:hypothetical protein